MSAEQLRPDHSEEDVVLCATALSNVHAFLHGELPEADADHIRQHLMACETCMDDFDVEATISAMLKRCFPPTTATPKLRMRVQQLHIRIHDERISDEAPHP